MNQINLFYYATSIQDGYYRNTSNADLHLAPAELALFLQADNSHCSSESGSSSDEICSIISHTNMCNVRGSAEI